MSSMAKIALFSLSCKPFHVFNMFFPFSFIPFFIFYISLVKRGIKEGRRRTCSVCFGTIFLAFCRFIIIFAS